ncbi:MAG: hypothetical protein BGO69_19345 [Bacteroidetes bacterium 46-16]|nr:MAG: hypothetical protein BGO69_19345 [Bacteroidetes bacterium 46-16]
MPNPIDANQKSRFSQNFNRMMQNASPELKKKWDGVVNWDERNNKPDIQANIINGLTPAMKARYIDLLNKLRRGEL